MTEGRSLANPQEIISDDSLPRYEYTPLQNSQVRFLTIHPGQNADGDTLKTSLSVHNLMGRNPKWEAISYSWGDSAFSNSVLVDGRLVFVNHDAYSALWHLRLPHQKRIVWLDQVCIDQANEDERYRQVPLMGHIFRNARQVIVYLCDVWPGAEVLFRFYAVARDVPNVWNLAWWYGWRQVSEGSPLRRLFPPHVTLPPATIRRLEQFNDHVDEIFDAHNELLANRYFSRTWIIQEIGLSSRCIIHCSQHWVTWEWFEYIETRLHDNWKARRLSSVLYGMRTMSSLTLLRDWYIGRRPSLQSLATQIIGNPQVRRLRAMWRVFRSTIKHVLKPDRTRLLPIIRKFRYQRSTDGRDKVFGLLGLAHLDQVKDLLEACGSDDEVKQNLCRISNVMFSFAIWHFRSTRTLDVLMGTCYKGTFHADLPYWVADWSCEPPSCDTDCCLPYRTFPHQAGTQHWTEPEVLIGSRALVVRGVAFDVVEEVVDAFADLTVWHDPRHETWQKWKDFAMKRGDCQADDPYGDETAHFEAYWRTLIYDVDGTGERASREAYETAFRGWTMEPTQESDACYAQIKGRIYWTFHRLFRTRRGYLGNGCVDVRAGDLVCVLHGGRLPFILRFERDVEGMPARSVANGHDPKYRKLRGHYMIGGDAYVHGICEGQAWDLAQRQGIATQEFALI